MIEFMHLFSGLELSDDAMPDESILKFRRLRDKRAFAARMTNSINNTFERGGLLLKFGPIVGARVSVSPVLLTSFCAIVVFKFVFLRNRPVTLARIQRTAQQRSLCLEKIPSG